VIIGSLLLIFAAVVMLGLGLPARSDPLLIGSIVATLFAVVVLIGSARRTAALRLAAGGDGRVGDGPTPGGAARQGPVRQGSTRQGSTRQGRMRPDTVRSGPARSGPTEGEPVRRPATGTTAAGTTAGGGTVIEGSLVEEPVTTPAGTGQAASGPAGEPASKSATATVERTTVGPTARGDNGRDATIPGQARPTIDLNARPATRVDAEDGEEDGEDYADGEFSDEDPPGEPPPQLVSAADAELVATMDAAVLVVDGRPRYHRAGCGHLRGRPTEPLPVSEAVELGFTPCSRCEPDTALIAGARPS
jgi:hypothetical protein